MTSFDVMNCVLNEDLSRDVEVAFDDCLKPIFSASFVCVAVVR